LIHSTPFNERQIETYHWHIEIIPRITRVAGFEWGTGFYINPVPPEDAAKYLREIQI
jgi:UDPglucose--hexose-1-phosphate uridylyltransferase